MALMEKISRYYFIVMALIGVSIFFGQVAAQSSAVAVTTSTLCGIIGGVRSVVGVIALVLFIVGGALYAVAHMMPAAGNLRGNVQGWSLGMIVGGIVGLIIVLIAPAIIGAIAGVSLSGSGSITSPSCI
jgi:hypothetical protein